jgi:hypothetical protein
MITIMNNNTLTASLSYDSESEWDIFVWKVCNICMLWHRQPTWNPATHVRSSPDQRVVYITLGEHDSVTNISYKQKCD